MSFLIKSFLLSFLFLGMTACDSSSGDSSPTVDVTGRWSGTATLGTDTTSTSFRMTQDGANVTAVDSDGDTWAGTVSGNKLELVTSFSEGANVGSAEVSGRVEDTTMILTGSAEGTFDGINFNSPTTINLTRN